MKIMPLKKETHQSKKKKLVKLVGVLTLANSVPRYIPGLLNRRLFLFFFCLHVPNHAFDCFFLSSNKHGNVKIRQQKSAWAWARIYYTYIYSSVSVYPPKFSSEMCSLLYDHSERRNSFYNFCCRVVLCGLFTGVFVDWMVRFNVVSGVFTTPTFHTHTHTQILSLPFFFTFKNKSVWFVCTSQTPFRLKANF